MNVQLEELRNASRKERAKLLKIFRITEALQQTRILNRLDAEFKKKGLF
jgi:hypothetical protein